MAENKLILVLNHTDRYPELHRCTRLVFNSPAQSSGCAARTSRRYCPSGEWSRPSAGAARLGPADGAHIPHIRHFFPAGDRYTRYPVQCAYQPA